MFEEVETPTEIPSIHLSLEIVMNLDTLPQKSAYHLMFITKNIFNFCVFLLGSYCCLKFLQNTPMELLMRLIYHYVTA